MLSGARAIYHILSLCAACRRDRYHQSVHRGCGVATDDVYAELVARKLHTLVERIECLDGNLRRDAERYDHLLGACVHRQDVVYAAHYCLIAEVLEWKVAQVEVYALGHHIGSEEHHLVAEVYDCGIVASTHNCCGVAPLKTRCEAVNKSELA